MEDRYSELLIRIDERVEKLQRDVAELKKYMEKVPIIEARFEHHLENHRKNAKTLYSIIALISSAVSALISYLLGR